MPTSPSSGPEPPTSCRGSGAGTRSSSPSRRPSAGSSAAQTNLAYNALDHHVERGRGGHAAADRRLNERGERRVFTYAQLRHEVERAAAALRGMGIGSGDRITIYMPTCPEAIVLMLACRAHRRDPLGRLRRLRRRRAGRPHRGQRLEGRVHRRRHLPQGQGGAAQGIVDAGGRACGRRRRARGRRCARAASTPTAAAATLLGRVPRARRRAGRRLTSAMEANEPAYILATSGTTAKPKLAVHTPRRLRRSTSTRMARWVFGLRADRRLVVDLGHRLGRRPQLHRLRAAAGRLHDDRLRGRARLSRSPTAFWRIVEELGVTGVFTSPTAVRLLMRYGGGARPRARPLVARAGLLRRRGAQPARLGVAPEGGARGPRPGHRPHVADGDRRPGLRQPVRHRPCCRSSRARPASRCPASRRPWSTRTASELRARTRRGSWSITRPFPGLTADALGRARALRPPTTGSASPARLLHRRRGRTSTRTATSGSPAAPTRSSRSPPTASARSRSRPPSCAIRPSPRPASPGGPDELRGEVISAFVVLKHGQRAVGRARARSCSQTVRRELGPVAVIGELNFVDDAAEDAQRQDHAPRAQGGHARPRPRRHHDDRGRGLGRGGPRRVAGDARRGLTVSVGAGSDPAR